MKTDPSMIDIDDENRRDDRPVEVPVFAIESSDSPADEKTPSATSKRERRMPYVKTASAVLALIIFAVWMLAVRNDYREPQISSSVSDKENLELLKLDYTPVAKGSTLSSDSVFGVAFDMFSLDGLTASLERELPDTTDAALVLFMRSADYHPDNSWIGTVVKDGVRHDAKERKIRPAYVAISKTGKPAIGISNDDDLADFAEDNNGSFFRQFVLLGNGELPSKFSLHGKVERAAIGRMADGKMYYVTTRHRETMYDFADALREYGFMDAVYITGGNGYSFYRDPQGISHNSHIVADKYSKYCDTVPPAPLLVFRNTPRN